MEGLPPPKKGQPKYPYATMKELRQHAEKNGLSIADVMMANEVSVSGKTEDQINAFLDKIAGAMLATVKSGLSVKDDVLPGPSSCNRKRRPSGNEPMPRNMKATAPSRLSLPARLLPRKRTPVAIWSSPHRPADRRA